MGDEFRIPPSQRKEPKRFEPPPWEREAFDEIQRRRAEQDADVEIAEAVAGLGKEEAQGEAEAVKDEPGGQAAQAGEVGERVEPHATPLARPVREAPQLDEQQVTAMLLELAVTEKQSHKRFERLNLVLMALTAAIGAVLVVWGGAALSRAKQMGQVGVLGGLGLMFFGALFFGVAVWMAVRQLRQQGVL